MDRVQKVRSVPHGQIYRPVFDAEEQLIKSIKSHKNPLPVLESPEVATLSGSGDIFDRVTRSSDRYEFENDLSVSEVKNLPDRLPPIDRSQMPASRLEKIYVRREARHKRIVHDFATEMKFGLENLQTKIKDLSTALKTRLDLNKEDVIQAIAQFDSHELMKEATEEDFCKVWEICKSVSESNFHSIQQFKSAFHDLQSLRTKRVSNELQATLQRMLQNAFLSKEDNYKVIETEAMLVNEANLTNSKCISRLVMNLIEEETERAIKSRIDYNERKAKWTQWRIEARMEHFGLMIDSEDTVNPSAVIGFLEELRTVQAPLVAKRDKELDFLTTIQPQDVTVSAFEAWTSRVEAIQMEIDDHINSTLENIKNEYIRISKWLYEEELKMREDLEEMTDPGEMERLMEPFMDRVDHQIDSHYMKVRELAVNFEDLSCRSVKQISLNAKLFSELIQTWNHHKSQIDSRKNELTDNLSETRKEYDEHAQQREADINVKIDDLRQADHADKIPHREDTIKTFLTEGVLQFKHFQNRQTNTLNTYNNVNLRELEIYKKNLEYIANLHDEELEKVEFYADRQDSLLSSLSDLSRAAGEKWEWLLKKRNKDFTNNNHTFNLKADQADQAILDKYKVKSPSKDQKSRGQTPTKSRASSAVRKSINANRMSISPTRTNRMSVSPTKEDRKKAKNRAKYSNDDADSIASLSDQLFRANYLKPRQSWYWDDRGYIVKKKYRKPEIPPISWFYETGGISPSPRKDKTGPKIVAVDVKKGPEEAQIDIREILHENPEDEDVDTECEEIRRSRHESAIACRNAGFKPYSFIAELGDLAVQHPDFQPVFQENFMLDRDALLLRNRLRVTFAKHYEYWSNELMDGIRADEKAKIQLFENEFKLKTDLQKDRIQSIHQNISLARKEELKSHVGRIQRHEADILNKMKVMLEQVNITKDHADLIVTRLKNLDNPQTSKYIPKFVAARKEKDLIKVKEEIDEELDAVKNLLQDNHDKFMKEHNRTIRSIRDSGDLFIKGMKLFKNGGNFAKSEVDTFKTRIKKLDVKLSRFDTFQITTIDQMLPEKIEKVEQVRRNLMEIYDVHLKDVVVINMVFKINRESHVLIGSELARMQKSIKDKFDEAEQLEKLFRAHWSPQHGVENLSSVKLHTRLTEFRDDLQKKVDSMKNPKAYQTNKDLPSDFYTKWLKGIDGDWSVRNAEGGSRLNAGTRSSVMNMSRRSSRLAMNLPFKPPSSTSSGRPDRRVRRNSSLKPRTSPTEKLLPPNSMPRPILSQAPPQTAPSINRKSTEQSINPVVGSASTVSNGENKVVRRKLLDAKSELKQQIFGFHIKPKSALDFPIGITRLLFEKTTKILDTYEEYYKTKGLRSPTRSELLLDNFEKTCEKVKNDIHEQELKAVQKATESYEVLVKIIKKTEKLHTQLPKIIFHQFMGEVEEKTNTRLETIQLRRQKLMDAFEEAKHEHFESIRINIGHPSYHDTLQDLISREATRRKKHSRATKERAECLIEFLNKEMQIHLHNLNTLLDHCFKEFDKIVQSGEIMPDDTDAPQKKQFQIINGERVLEWAPFQPADLPKFDVMQFLSKKETAAHYELDRQKDVLLVKMKTYYRAELSKIEDQEQEQLAEIQRWVNFWKLQLSEIKAVFED